MLSTRDQSCAGDLVVSGSTATPAFAGRVSYARGGGSGVTDRPVPLFVPPEVSRRTSTEPLPVPPVPARYPQTGLDLGIAAVNASGRVREQQLILKTLGWRAGDRTSSHVIADGIVIRREHDGHQLIDPRNQLLIPAGLRTLYRIGAGDRIVLVAIPEQEVLIVHPTAFVAGLLAEHYASLPAGIDGR